MQDSLSEVTNGLKKTKKIRVALLNGRLFSEILEHVVATVIKVALFFFGKLVNICTV